MRRNRVSEMIAQRRTELGNLRPEASDDDENIALLAVDAPDEGWLRSVFDAGPWTVHRIFRIKAMRHWL